MPWKTLFGGGAVDPAIGLVSRTGTFLEDGRNGGQRALRHQWLTRLRYIGMAQVIVNSTASSPVWPVRSLDHRDCGVPLDVDGTPKRWHVTRIRFGGSAVAMIQRGGEGIVEVWRTNQDVGF